MARALRVSEVFTTIQGEGPNVGKPTTFLRFGGCNLRCAGWGTTTLPSGEVVGSCDTPYAVYPEFFRQWTKTDTQALVDEATSQGNTHYSLTGGEPLQQDNDLLWEVIDSIRHVMPLATFDMFTNGTKSLPFWVMKDWFTVCMDWKMPKSGEYGKFLELNLSRVSGKDMVKFVIDVDNQQDVEAFLKCAQRANTYIENPPSIYVGPVWDTDVTKLAMTIPEWQKELNIPLRMNVQMHNYIFPKGVDGGSSRENQVLVELGKKP